MDAKPILFWELGHRDSYKKQVLLSCCYLANCCCWRLRPRISKRSRDLYMPSGHCAALALPQQDSVYASESCSQILTYFWYSEIKKTTRICYSSLEVNAAAVRIWGQIKHDWTLIKGSPRTEPFHLRKILPCSGNWFVCVLDWVSRLNAFRFVTVAGYKAQDALNLKKKKSQVTL